MNRKSGCSGSFVVIDRFMDVTMIATTAGCAAAANMLYPSLGSALIGAVLGAIFGFTVSRSAE
jgi:hypothetical protein